MLIWILSLKLLAWRYLASHCGMASTPSQPQSLVICEGFTLPFWLDRNIITVCIHSWSMWMPDNPVNNALNPAEYTKINNKRSQWHSTRSRRASFLIFHFFFFVTTVRDTKMCCQKPSFSGEGISLDSAKKPLPQNSLSSPFCHKEQKATFVSVV